MLTFFHQVSKLSGVPFPTQAIVGKGLANPVLEDIIQKDVPFCSSHKKK